jgi:hypothetical protein
MTDERIYDRVAEILEQARSQVARAVTTAMVQVCWLIDREIVEVEQAGKARPGYKLLLGLKDLEDGVGMTSSVN